MRVAAIDDDDRIVRDRSRCSSGGERAGHSTSAASSVDDKASVGGQELVLNGAGVRKRAIFKVYVGSLYVPAKAARRDGVLAKGPRRIQINLLRNLSADQLIDALIDGLKENNTRGRAAGGQVADRRAGRDHEVVRRGEGRQRRHARFRRRRDARSASTARRKGRSPGEAFNRALTRIWLGDNPVQADLKKAMLAVTGAHATSGAPAAIGCFASAPIGRLRVTDDFLRSYLLRPELAPIPESCAAELALHDALIADPRRAVSPRRARGDRRRRRARELRRSGCAFAIACSRADSLEAAYVAPVPGDGVDVPPLFVAPADADPAAARPRRERAIRSRRAPPRCCSARRRSP